MAILTYDCLIEARIAAQVTGSRRMLWQILAMLAGLESDPTEADQLRKQAGEIVAYIADHISDPDLSASFLSLPQVQAAST